MGTPIYLAEVIYTNAQETAEFRHLVGAFSSEKRAREAITRFREGELDQERPDAVVLDDRVTALELDSYSKRIDFGKEDDLAF